MPKRGPIKRVTYLFDYFDYNLFGIKLVNALRGVLRNFSGDDRTDLSVNLSARMTDLSKGGICHPLTNCCKNCAGIHRKLSRRKICLGAVPKTSSLPGQGLWPLGMAYNTGVHSFVSSFITTCFSVRGQFRLFTNSTDRVMTKGSQIEIVNRITCRYDAALAQGSWLSKLFCHGSIHP
jgi:hypothetical protein